MNSINKPIISILNILTYIFFSIFLISFILPISPSMPSYGLDPSYRLAIHYAFFNNFQFGEDIYFTYGPLADFWFPNYFYSESTYKISILLSSLLSITIFLSLIVISKNSQILVKIIGLFAIMVGFKMGDSFLWYILPVLFVAISFIETHYKKASTILAIFLIFFLSFSILVKFSHFPTAFLAVLFVDLYFVIKEKVKFPKYTVLLFVFMILLFGMSGQNIVNFPAYFIGSFNTLSGYSESMQSSGPRWMIYLFSAFCLSMLFVLLKSILTSKNSKIYLFVLISALVLFMSFKNGFVRHDSHAIAAFSGLSFIFGLLLLYFADSLKTSFIRLSLVLILTIGASASSLLVTGRYLGHQPFYTIILNSFHDIKNRFSKIPDLLKDSKIVKLNSSYKNSMQNIRNQVNLSDINGTVDIYPWDQSFVIAHGLNYRPRPLFQSYSVYTPYLIEKNIEFLKSNRAPETILFSIKEIDRRAPFMMEGASWLEIIKRYDVVDKISEFLVLKKVKSNKDYKIAELFSKTIAFNEEISIPAKKEIFAKINIKKNIFGKLVNTLFKSPVLYIELTLEDGSKKKYRIVPGISSSGFILSPYINSIFDFFAYSVDQYKRNYVKSFKIINKSGCCYSDKIELSIGEIYRSAIKANKHSTKLNELSFYNDILALNTSLKAPYFQLENYNGNDIIFSHVGMSFLVNGLTLKSISDQENRLKVEYSLKSESYTNGNNSEGACFNIYSDNEILHQQCIDPKVNEADRAVQSYVLKDIDENKTYRFEVVPIKGRGSAYGWSYWKFRGGINESK